MNKAGPRNSLAPRPAFKKWWFDVDETQRDGTNLKLLFVVLGIAANLLLGGVTFYASRLSTDIEKLDGIARAGATSATILGRDVESLTKWTVDQVGELKERVRALERR